MLDPCVLPIQDKTDYKDNLYRNRRMSVGLCQMSDGLCQMSVDMNQTSDDIRLVLSCLNYLLKYSKGSV